MKIQLRSNLSWSLDRLAGFSLVLSTVTLLVALLPTLMGYWTFLVLHDRRFEIGRFLPASERVQAGKLIEQALAPHTAWYQKRMDETASSG